MSVRDVELPHYTDLVDHTYFYISHARLLGYYKISKKHLRKLSKLKTKQKNNRKNNKPTSSTVRSIKVNQKIKVNNNQQINNRVLKTDELK